MFNITVHADGAAAFPELGDRPQPVTYHGSKAKWHGPAWAAEDGGLCPTCRYQHRALGWPIPAESACLLFRTVDGWHGLHRVRAQSFSAVESPPIGSLRGGRPRAARARSRARAAAVRHERRTARADLRRLAA